MNFESADITAFELEIQIAVENASIEKKALTQVLKELNPQTKQYKKALEALDKAQQKEWRMLSKEIENQKDQILTETQTKIPAFQSKIESLKRAIAQQSEKMAEKRPAQPIGPRRPGK